MEKQMKSEIIKRIYSSWRFGFLSKVRRIPSSWRDWLTPAVIIATGGIVALIIDCSQRESAEKIASDQQKLLALQIFGDRLMGNRIERDLTLKLMHVIADTNLIDSLTDISNRAAIELNADSIWGVTVNGREDAIQEYAKLYHKYPKEVISILRKKIPDTNHLNEWPPVISISKFFTYLGDNGDSLWLGTKDDSVAFATLKKSKYYKYTHDKKPDSANVRGYLERGLRNFRERKIAN
jgi:hypothetical protein